MDALMDNDGHSCVWVCEYLASERMNGKGEDNDGQESIFTRQIIVSLLHNWTFSFCLCVPSHPSISPFVNPFHRMCSLSLGSRKYFFPSSTFSLSLSPTHPSIADPVRHICIQHTQHTQHRYTITNTHTRISKSQHSCLPLCFGFENIFSTPTQLIQGHRSRIKLHPVLACLIHITAILLCLASLLFFFFFFSSLQYSLHSPPLPLRVSFISRIFCTKYIYVFTHFQLDIFQRKFLWGQEAVLCDNPR